MIRCLFNNVMKFSKNKSTTNKYAAAFNELVNKMNIQFQSQQEPNDPKQIQHEIKQAQQFKELFSQFVQTKVKKPRLRKEINLKVIRDKQTFDNPAGQIKASFYEKFIEEEKEIIKENQEELKEYMEGEKKIDKRPIDKKYVFKISELFNMIALQEQQKKLTLDIDTINRNSDEIAYKVQKYKKQFVEKEEQGDVQIFWNHVQAYPGSRLGPLPHDDPQTFYKYIKGRVPASIKEQYRRQTGQFFAEQDQIFDAEFNQQQQKEQDIRKSARRTPLTFRNILNQNRHNPGEQFMGPNDRVAGTTSTFNITEQTLPVIPEFQLKDYQANWQVWLLWQKFRYYHGLMHSNNIFRKAEEYFSQVDASSIQTQPMGSLYNYYKTLPKFLQEHEGVRTVYLGLQYKSPQWTISQKQQALNKAAYLCLPVEKACSIMLQDHFSLDKWRMTTYQIDRLFNIKPQFTYEVQDFYNQIKDEKIRGQKSGQNKLLSQLDQQKVQIPQTIAPSLPVDFYDNEDGFWDNYIKHKMNRQAPVATGRKYFKH